MTMPPKPTPNQHSDPASAGVERAPPRSAAIAFSATTAIHGAPNEHAMASKETLATTQEALVSMEDLVTSAPEPAPVPRLQRPKGSGGRGLLDRGTDRSNAGLVPKTCKPSGAMRNRSNARLIYPKAISGASALAMPIETAVTTSAIDMMRATVAMSSASAADRRCRWREPVKPILPNWADIDALLLRISFPRGEHWTTSGPASGRIAATSLRTRGKLVKYG
jgi:hypothetical protein